MGQFDYFVVFAEMRTGSNFLETNLNAFDGITCHGEAFNPYLLSYPDTEAVLDVTREMRDAEPALLLRAIKQAPGLNGFRYFHDHDPRIFDKIMDDARCAKIILTRNPVDSYISWKIARATGQWKLTDAKARKDGKAEFVEDEFHAHLANLQGFQVTLLNRLQVSGQTAFYLAYEDLQSVEVMNGLAAWLGVPARLETLDKTLKVQNPGALSDKVSNFGHMQQALSAVDPFNLTRTPNFEPRRGAAVPTYVICNAARLVYLPIRGGVADPVAEWLRRLDKQAGLSNATKLSQGALRDWMRANPGHRRFSVLRHPLERAHDVFCTRILSDGKGAYGGIKATLKRRYKLPLPETANAAGYDKAAHRDAFAAFLGFLKANLAGQTAVRVDPDWATQATTVEGFADFALPDRLIRAENMEPELQVLVGSEGAVDLPQTEQTGPYALRDIYDVEIEKLARAAYARDYVTFGFEDWRA